MRRDRIAYRTNQLLESGRCRNRFEALKVAERENPFEPDSAYTAWSQRRDEALRQKAAQDRFEQELDALRRK